MRRSIRQPLAGFFTGTTAATSASRCETGRIGLQTLSVARPDFARSCGGMRLNYTRRRADDLMHWAQRASACVSRLDRSSGRELPHAADDVVKDAFGDIGSDLES